MGKRIPLAELKKAESAIITEICSDALRARLHDMGFSEGTKAVCAGSGIFGDPSAYLIEGALIALRRRDAEMILCERTEPPL